MRIRKSTWVGLASVPQYWGFSHGNEKAGHGAGEEVGRIRSQLVLFPSIKMLLKPVGYREPK